MLAHCTPPCTPSLQALRAAAEEGARRAGASSAPTALAAAAAAAAAAAGQNGKPVGARPGRRGGGSRASRAVAAACAAAGPPPVQLTERAAVEVMIEEAGLWGSLHPATLLQLQPDHAAALVRYVDPHPTPPPQTTHARFTLRPRLRLRPSLGLSLGLGLTPTRYADLVDESDAPLSEWVKTTQASCLARRHTPRRLRPRVPPCAPTLPHASPWEAPRPHAPPRLWQVRPAASPLPSEVRRVRVAR